jgi:hypothetical protein
MIFSFSKAQNDIKSTLESSIDVVSTAVQRCPSMSAEQKISLINCNNVDLSNITFDQTVDLNTSCIQDSTFMQDATQDIEEQFSQLSKSLQEGLSLADVSITDNAIQDTMSLKTTLISGFEQNCGSSHDFSQSFECVGSNNVKVRGLSYKQTIDDIVNCTMTSSSVQTAATKVTKIFDQKAISEQKGLLGGLGGIIAGIIALVIIVMIAKGGGGGAGGKPGQTLLWKIMLVVSLIGLLCGGVMVAFYFLGWWPYNKIYPTSTEEEKQKNKAIFVPSIIVSGVSLLLLIVLVLYASKKKTQQDTAIQQAKLEAISLGKGIN